jgi:predicted ferric reductase
MRSALKGIVAGIVGLALLGAIAARAGWIETALPRPHGTGAWMLSRATGLLAYAALSLDVIAGLLVATRTVDRIIPRAAMVEIHGWLSPVMLASVATHAGVLVADSYVRFDVVDVLVPFASGRWPVAIGTLAAYVLVVVHLSFGLRRRIGSVMWRRVHYLSFVAFVLATLHAIAAGTDSSRPAYMTVYTVLLAIVSLLVGVRTVRALNANHA